MIQDFINNFFNKSDNSSVDTLIEKCSYASAAMTLFPIPGSEIIAVMPIHVGMVIGIGQAYGVVITRESAMNLLMQISATVGLSLIGSRIAVTTAKIILPGFGGVISAPFIFASTIALGNIAKAYFEAEGELDKSSMKDIYNDMIRRAKKEFNPEKMEEDDIKDMAKAASEEKMDSKTEAPAAADTPTERLQKLKELLDQNLISQEEFDSTKERILSEI